MKGQAMTTTMAGRIVGGLFLSGFFLYGGGSFLIASTTDSNTALPGNAASMGELSAGAALLLLNSVAVATIGALAFRVLRGRHQRTAHVYLVTRTAEAVVLALAPLGTLTLTLLTRGRAETTNAPDSGLQSLVRTAVENSQRAYCLAMTPLRAGSIVFGLGEARSALLPRFLAVW